MIETKSIKYKCFHVKSREIIFLAFAGIELYYTDALTLPVKSIGAVEFVASE